MNKKLAVLLSLVLILVAVAAFASAETKLTLDAPNGQGSAQSATVSTMSKGATTVSKAVNVYPKRGGTVNLWYWYNNTGCVNMSTGSDVNRVMYTVRGNRFYVQVTQGSGWLGVRSTGGFGNFQWSMTPNTGTQMRIGKIRVYDRYGTICFITIRQAPIVRLVSAYQMPYASHNGKVRLESTLATGTNGKIYNNYNKYRSAYSPVKWTTAGIWYHENLPAGVTQHYFVRLYRVLNGRKLYGPASNVLSCTPTH